MFKLTVEDLCRIWQK